ncbi:hypothetical protein [Solimonas sp. K1W22B-7]|uniref:hypothetical protein n=1 Tax=Solimonas sp. K1W22B-7 TaxID=2303331 RepID=UPI0013C42DD4|nr:hypothetical protein [Solimonas sp. K1W22B-7]
MAGERAWRTVLSADLGGSTAAYEKLADARQAVDRHLHALSRITHQHSGERVKTPGDAVPTCFRGPDPVVGDDAREVFLRRESLPLAGRGVISLGCPLLEQTGETLRYSCE